MHTSQRNERTPIALIRHVSWGSAVILALIACVLESASSAGILRITAASIFAVGTVMPRLFYWPCVLLIRMGQPLYSVVNRLVPERVRAAIVQVLDVNLARKRLPGRRRGKRRTRISLPVPS